MLKRNQTDEKTLKRLGRIEEATNMLQERYNELDHLIKTQTTQKIQEEFSIDELLQKRVAFLQNIYPSHSIELHAEKKTLLGDPIGLAKAIDNLIDNAVKYSPKDSKITVTFQDSILSIADNGKGIEEVELVKIFDRFYQQDTQNPGFGIGLYMVKRFCDKNGIELLIHSKKGMGTKVDMKFKEKN